MVFVNFAPDAAPLSEYLEVLPEHFRNWDLRGWYVETHVRKHLPGNWKLAMEAFMEAYHTPFVHPEMTNVVGDHNMQHDIFSRHVSRDLCAMGTASPTARVSMSEQQMLDMMLVGDGKMVGDRAIVPEGKTARWVMAEQLRERMKREFGLDYSSLFGSGDDRFHQVSRLSQHHDLSGTGSMPCAAVPPRWARPRPGDIRPVRASSQTARRQVRGRGSRRDCRGRGVRQPGEHGPFLASVLDQDTDIMRAQREGMYTSGKGAETLSIYQELRIRHFHQTLGEYMQDTSA